MDQPPVAYLQAADGYRLAYRRFSPEPAHDARAVVVIAPAMGVGQDFYSAFAQWLMTQRVIAYTFDYRGSGASLPDHGQLRGFKASIDDWARLDCAALIDHTRALEPQLPLYWLGHSIGAQILGLIPNRDQVRAMLSVAAGSGYYRYNASPVRYYVPLLWFVIAPLALRIAGYFPGKRMRVVGDLPHGVMTQWRKWCLSVDYLGGESQAARDALAAVETPITALSMQDDELMTLRGTRALFSLYTRAPIEVRVVRPADYGVSGIGHFGFFRPKMQRALWPLVPRWIEQAAARTPDAAVA